MKPMKRGALAALALLTAGQCGAQTLDEAATNTHCAAKWPADFAMQKYCAEQITTGFDTFRQHSERAAKLDGFDMQALESCAAKWTEQWDMVAYCAGQHIDGLSAFNDTLADLPDNIAKEIGPGCKAKWPADHAMQSYCASQQAKAWKDLQ